jgi:hypothetical protein
MGNSRLRKKKRSEPALFRFGALPNDLMRLVTTFISTSNLVTLLRCNRRILANCGDQLDRRLDMMFSRPILSSLYSDAEGEFPGCSRFKRLYVLPRIEQELLISHFGWRTLNPPPLMRVRYDFYEPEKGIGDRAKLQSGYIDLGIDLKALLDLAKSSLLTVAFMIALHAG